MAAEMIHTSFNPPQRPDRNMTSRAKAFFAVSSVATLGIVYGVHYLQIQERHVSVHHVMCRSCRGT